MGPIPLAAVLGIPRASTPKTWSSGSIVGSATFLFLLLYSRSLVCLLSVGKGPRWEARRWGRPVPRIQNSVSLKITGHLLWPWESYVLLHRAVQTYRQSQSLTESILGNLCISFKILLLYPHQTKRSANARISAKEYFAIVYLLGLQHFFFCQSRCCSLRNTVTISKS